MHSLKCHPSLDPTSSPEGLPDERDWALGGYGEGVRGLGWKMGTFQTQHTEKFRA